MILRLDDPKHEQGYTEDVNQPAWISRLFCSYDAEGLWFGDLPEVTTALVTNTRVH